jgi:DNA polymerase-3 subunit chi
MARYGSPCRKPAGVADALAEAANGATVRFVTDGAELPVLEGVERLVLMFDGHDQMQLEAARGQWKSLKSDGHDLTYWQQTEDRRWQKKA